MKLTRQELMDEVRPDDVVRRLASSFRLRELKLDGVGFSVTRSRGQGCFFNTLMQATVRLAIVDFGRLCCRWCLARLLQHILPGKSVWGYCEFSWHGVNLLRIEQQAESQ